MNSYPVTPDPTSDQESPKRRKIVGLKQAKIPQSFAGKAFREYGSTESRRS